MQRQHGATPCAFQVRLTGSKCLVLGQSADGKRYSRVEVDGKRTVTLSDSVVREWLKMDDRIRDKFLQPKKEGTLGLADSGASFQFKRQHSQDGESLYWVAVTTRDGGTFTVVANTYRIMLDALKVFYVDGRAPPNSQKLAVEDLSVLLEFADVVCFMLLLVPRFRCRGCAAMGGGEPSQDDHECMTMEPQDLDEHCLMILDANLFRALVCMSVKVWCEEYMVDTFSYLYLLEAAKDLKVPRDLDRLKNEARDFDETKKDSVRRVLDATVGVETA